MVYATAVASDTTDIPGWPKTYPIGGLEIGETCLNKLTIINSMDRASYIAT